MGTRMLDRAAAVLNRPIAELLYVLLWKSGLRRRAPQAAHRAIFTRIHDANEWGSAESRSGPGSTRARGADFREDLIALLRRFEVATLLDAPCGDFNWMREVTSALALSYIGVDVVAALVAENQRRYGDAGHRFLTADLTSDVLPPADLIICRDALVHFSFADIRAAISNFQRSGSRYLLTTSFSRLSHNEDIRTGGWRALSLQLDPFRFPEPIAFIDDEPAQASGAAAGKRLCLWTLDSLEL